MKFDFLGRSKFEDRHNGIMDEDFAKMLSATGVETIDQLIDEAVPEKIRNRAEMNLPEAKTEQEFLKHISELASKNKILKTYIGMGYYSNFTPPVILRNILENPGWYTAYTPYQAEIAQGRLEALINFQTMVSDLTGMELANASLLDEGTAAAEAMSMFFSLRKGAKKKTAFKFGVDKNIFPQTLDILKTRAVPFGIELVEMDLFKEDLTDEFFGILIQYPNADGEVKDLEKVINGAHQNDCKVSVAADLLSLVLLKSPGSMGADAVLGTSQRFGVPLGYGGPHAAFFATREDFKRQIPGRIIGVSNDKFGKPAYRMALQTREQHIKREKATSNICTAQVLLAVMSGMYAVYHGPEGLKRIATKVHGLTCLLKESLQLEGLEVKTETFFDTLRISTNNTSEIKDRALEKGVNLRYHEDGDIGVSLDETTRMEDVEELVEILSGTKSLAKTQDIESPLGDLLRTDDFLTHEVFNTYHTEHEMLRYMKRLENKDLSLVHSMISLGSCTMKLNATAEMIPITLPGFANIHPFAPLEQAEGYSELINDLSKWLTEITGFSGISLQPNSGAQGEYAGLMVIREYHKSRGEGHRNITLIPSSAHGTNPASAIMAGTEVVIVACDEKGNIDFEDLKVKVEQHSANLAALMVTYPSTHGVFETEIKEICQLIHQHGGQVYMDGANLNAQLGLTSPGYIGADVCHLNLHKTFCIPHGGGGPGMGPIGVAKHLIPFLPGNEVVKTGGDSAITAISAAPWGSAGILPISYGYIAMMGAQGLKNATERAILNTNYIKSKLEEYYKILYVGAKGRSAHEMIIDCRDFKKAGIEVEDIAKRLMDYGYHAPTVSFPVPGTMMIEPTESETRKELDKFCQVMISIRSEIQEVLDGIADKDNNVLKNAPHTSEVVISDKYNYPYTREKAAFPLEELKSNKFWPSVSRIDNAYGDRHLFCSCVPTEMYEEAVNA